MDKDQLRESALLQMRRALYAWSNGDHDMAVLHGGIAFEHIVKAALAARHPSLLSDGRDFSTLLHAAGLSSHATAPATHARTLGAAEAFKRARALLQLSVSERDVEPLLTARNGVAHLGAHDKTQSAMALTVAVTVVDAVLADIGEGDHDFWGPYRSRRHDLYQLQAETLADARQRAIADFKEERERRSAAADEGGDSLRALLEPLLADAEERTAHEEELRAAVQDIVTVKIRYAKKLFRIAAGRQSTAADLKRLARMAEIRKWYRPEACDESFARCPVCGYARGVLRARIGPDGQGIPDRHVRECFAVMFDCPVCGLELDGRPELQVSGLVTHYYKDLKKGSRFSGDF
ncbi:hypothetical protein [Streptacidiphilus melanogenes]|uniref:hypothetical protein n=1 Tax=Streptacidiphilus melanogenes TaxID=411235 RepID=UPI00126A500C|nr:hypothetical protein [Streptacidiphilus melanogenes]